MTQSTENDLQLQQAVAVLPLAEGHARILVYCEEARLGFRERPDAEYLGRVIHNLTGALSVITARRDTCIAELAQLANAGHYLGPQAHAASHVQLDL